MHDLVISNVLIADGLGSELKAGALAVDGGKITEMGAVTASGRLEIDGRGHVLAPGFINAHSHADMVCESNPELASDLEQGITTQIAGSCGIGAAPLRSSFIEEGASVTRMLTDYPFYKEAQCRNEWGDYAQMLRKRRFGTNLAMMVGHGSLRSAVMGLENRACTEAELAQMCQMLTNAMQSGALGLTFGLEYPPGCYADVAEMAELSKVVTRFGGVVSAHIRNEDDRLLEAVDEMLSVARESGVRMVFSHHKTIYRRNWGKTEQTLTRIEKANKEGGDIYCDQYPYLAASTGLKSRIPSRLFSMGDDAIIQWLADESKQLQLRNEILGGLSVSEKFGETLIGNSSTHPEYTGKYLIDIANAEKCDPVLLLMRILHDDCLTTNGIFTYMTESDVNRVMCWERTMVGTDGLFQPGVSGAHPRAFGSFPRVLGRYVRENGVLTLSEAIRKMTSLTASVYGLRTKGQIAPGYDADLVLFDPQKIMDHADFHCFDASNEGIDWVCIGGRTVVADGKATGVLAGIML